MKLLTVSWAPKLYRGRRPAELEWRNGERVPLTHCAMCHSLLLSTMHSAMRILQCVFCSVRSPQCFVLALSAVQIAPNALAVNALTPPACMQCGARHQHKWLDQTGGVMPKVQPARCVSAARPPDHRGAPAELRCGCVWATRAANKGINGGEDRRLGASLPGS